MTQGPFGCVRYMHRVQICLQTRRNPSEPPKQLKVPYSPSGSAKLYTEDTKSDMSGTRMHVQGLQVDMIVTENSRRHQHNPEQAEAAKVTC